MFIMKQPTTSESPVYTEFHPRWYRPRVSVYWWLGEWHYLKFILRELSSIFVAWFVILTLVQLWALRNGPESYARFEHWLQNPLVIAVNIISLFFVVFHAITWFNLAPKAMAVRVRGKRLPDILLSAPNYAMWAVVSVAVGWILVR
jgi:fumarate reductase subunit C